VKTQTLARLIARHSHLWCSACNAEAQSNVTEEAVMGASYRQQLLAAFENIHTEIVEAESLVTQPVDADDESFAMAARGLLVTIRQMVELKLERLGRDRRN